LSGASRGAAVAACALLALAALAVQALGDGLFGTLAAAGSLPRALAGDWPFAVAERSGLDRIAAVRVTLARGALVRDEPARATALLAPLPATPGVVDLRGRAAWAQGDAAGALRDFAAAGDYIAAQTAIDALAARDPRAALAILRDFERRLDAVAASPEIGAEVEWREGQIAAAAGYEREALAAYRRALARAPDEEKYLLNDAFTALALGDAASARAAYTRAAQVVPDSVDAFVGVAVSAAALGDCTAARTALGRARAFAAEQRRAADPAAAGYAPALRSALRRCGA
jgi:tetratricopeptide (TPR) repeat protein